MTHNLWKLHLNQPLVSTRISLVNNRLRCIKHIRKVFHQSESTLILIGSSVFENQFSSNACYYLFRSLFIRFVRVFNRKLVSNNLYLTILVNFAIQYRNKRKMVYTQVSIVTAWILSAAVWSPGIFFFEYHSDGCGSNWTVHLVRRSNRPF